MDELQPQPVNTKQDLSWVREVLEPDQLVESKVPLGRRRLGPGLLVLLWVLRIYVLVMTVLIVYQVWQALHP
jgi:hypothetical protein|uniref:Uncharacterized protein n=1 Tax=Thermogemmatispora argillosa TaxID=2045280 RepID=A0A455T163_9CHLR|nr:hypothetical protein KTA_03640 [Thermogemmatispora argillosa]